MAICDLGDEPRVCSPGQADWQSILADSVHSPGELCRMLGLDASLAAEAERVGEGWPLLAPRPYIGRIRRGDSADPLLLQILPRADESATVPGYTTDPLGEAAALCGPGLLRKYQGRTLIVPARSCAVHCRFCFRRHFSGETGEGRGTRDGGRGEVGLCAAAPIPQSANIDPFAASPHPNPLPKGEGTINSPHLNPLPEGDGTIDLATIAADPSIHEAILSGGDPLMLADDDIEELTENLAAISHLRRLRIHTRLPVMIPQRVTGNLVRVIRQNRLTPVIVVHINHAAEIDGDVAKAFARLIESGIPLMSQSVLLRGVNDRAEVLAELFERLVDLRVTPYYLHQLDPVAGAAHFEVPIAAGRAIMAELRTRLPGYAVPRYVQETPGATSKQVLI
jgi:L-lysine 2,3-aminomutase